MKIQIRTKDDLVKLLSEGISYAWRVNKGRLNSITEVEIFNFNGNAKIVGSFDREKTKVLDNGRVAVAFTDAKIEPCQFKWLGQNPIKYKSLDNNEEVELMEDEVEESSQEHNESLKTFKISIQGFGAEVTIGTLNNIEIEMISSSNKSLDECVLEDFDDWRDKDDLYHNFGACSDYVFEITDENDELVCQLYSENLNEFDDEEFELKKYNSLNIDTDEPLLICISFHKGSVFQGEFETNEFDIKKLRLEIDDEVGIGTYYWGEMLRAIYYNDEEIYETDRYTDEESFEAYSNLN
jgi:hypothetical protein